MASFILDTSAILTVLNQEEGFDAILDILKVEESKEVYVPFMAFMELEYLLLRKTSPEETLAILELVKAWPVKITESDEEWRHQAAIVKANTPLSVADAWIASFALLKKAQLVHKDPEYEKVPGLSDFKLPYKK